MKKITNKELEQIVRKSFFTGWQAGLDILRMGAGLRYGPSKEDINKQTAIKLKELTNEILKEYKETIN